MSNPASLSRVCHAAQTLQWKGTKNAAEVRSDRCGITLANHLHERITCTKELQ